MNFQNLRFIIRHIRNRITCRGCDARYRSSDVYILEVRDTETTFALKCPKCSGLLMAHAIANISHRPQEITIYNPLEYISENDILDIHNFLNNFQGDFTPYIK